MSLFFRFAEGGKNVAIMARLFRVLGISLGFIKGAVVGIGGLITGITAPVWALMAALFAVGLVVFNYWVPIREFFKGFGSVIGSALSEAATAIGNFGKQKLIDTASLFGMDEATVNGHIDRTLNAITIFKNATVNIISSIASSIGDWLSDIFTMNEYSATAEAEFRSAGEKMAEAMLTIVRDIPAKIIGYFAGLGGKIAKAIGKVHIAGLDWVKNLLSDKSSNNSPSTPVFNPNASTANDAPAPGVFDKVVGGIKGLFDSGEVKQEVDAKINAAVIDKRPPQVTINAPITVNEAANGSGTAAQVQRELSNVVSKGQGGALHDGVD